MTNRPSFTNRFAVPTPEASNIDAEPKTSTIPLARSLVSALCRLCQLYAIVCLPGPPPPAPTVLASWLREQHGSRQVTR